MDGIRQSTKIKYKGAKYGMMTIVELTRRDPKHRFHYFVLCKCDCGTVKETRLSCLQQGTTKSCGCHAKAETIRRTTGNTYRRSEFGESAKKSLFTRYVNDAIKRGITFDLSYNHFIDLCSSDCYYCGKEPTTIRAPKNSHGTFTHNGVDRVDNSKGYTVENTVSACKKCNSLKNAVTRDMVFKLYHHLFPQT